VAAVPWKAFVIDVIAWCVPVTRGIEERLATASPAAGTPAMSSGPATLAAASLRDRAGPPDRAAGARDGTSPGLGSADHGVWSAMASTKSRAVATGSNRAPEPLSQRTTRQSWLAATPT
jgi:hypothetical protein